MEALLVLIGSLLVVGCLVLGLMTSLANAGTVFPRTQIRWIMSILALLLGALLAAALASATERSSAQVYKFRASHPCPANGKLHGACPGYVVDHINPLCAGGPDDPKNMQWQSAKDAAAKDVHEKQYCACLRAHKPVCPYNP